MIETNASEVFESRYRELYPQIYRYIYRLTGNIPDTEQLAQETFAGLYKLYSSPNGIRNPKALAYRIAHNVSLNYLKRRKKLDAIIGREDGHLSGTAASPEERLIEKQKIDQVRQALKSLPLRDQKCLLLYLEELSYAEISVAAGIKKSSVGKILARAAERLAGKIRNGDKR